MHDFEESIIPTFPSNKDDSYKSRNFLTDVSHFLDHFKTLCICLLVYFLLSQFGIMKKMEWRDIRLRIAHLSC